MLNLIVKANKLNKRSIIPSFLPDPSNIIGVVKKDFIFKGVEVAIVPNPALGKWYKDKDNHYYWGGGLILFDDGSDDKLAEVADPETSILENIKIVPSIKRKIEQVINVFETGSTEGNYSSLSKHRDHNDPVTKSLMVQVTYGRSQTTEFGHLKDLVQDYIHNNGTFSAQLIPFISQIGKKPSLATNDAFCNALKNAGKNDPVMKICQDSLFETKYYQPAHNWFSKNEFHLPLSMLVIYDSFIHSGSILPFLRKRFATVVPAVGGNEKDWISNYVNARHNWLANHSNTILHGTVYRTNCFKDQIKHDNWDLSQSLKANGVTIL